MRPGMSLQKPLPDMRARHMATRLMVHENIVRNRLMSGEPLTAREIIDGVRLSHDEFLELVSLALPALNEIIRKAK
jgi:hypothetical protein